jgi:hypothetical protein
MKAALLSLLRALALGLLTVVLLLVGCSTIPVATMRMKWRGSKHVGANAGKS